MSRRPIIAGAGEILWDILPDKAVTGGAPANCVYHAACLGAEGYIISAVGSDMQGSKLIDEIKKTPLHPIVGKVDKPTGSVTVSLENGIPKYSILEERAWDYIPVTDESLTLIKKADAVCFGTLACRNSVSRNTITTLLKHTSPSCLRLYDINIREMYYSYDVIVELLNYANVFKINKEEAEILKQMLHIDVSDEKLCRMFIEKYNLKYMIFTNGGVDSTIYSQEYLSNIKTPYVNVADTIGAGDAFAGAFLYFILNNMSLYDAHKMAVNVAAFVCTKKGAWPIYPQEIPVYIA